MTVTDIILIHGAWNRGACYDAVVPLLEARNYRVHAPDLTGHTPGDGDHLSVVDKEHYTRPAAEIIASAKRLSAYKPPRATCRIEKNKNRVDYVSTHCPTRSAFRCQPRLTGGMRLYNRYKLNAPLTHCPPCWSVCAQASFFMPSSGPTHAPPVSLQPGEAAIANSSPLESAVFAA